MRAVEGELSANQDSLVSRINHDCRPNTGYFFERETFKQYVYAIRDILPGEEITIAYIE